MSLNLLVYALKLLVYLVVTAGLVSLLNKVYLKSIISRSIDGIIIAKPWLSEGRLVDMRCLICNTAAVEILGRSDLVGSYIFTEYKKANTTKGFVAKYEELVLKGIAFKDTICVEEADKYLEFCSSLLPFGLVMISFRDITAITIASIVDPLTGLFNRATMYDAGVNYYSVLFLDVYKFKSINDTRGHVVGDIVLKAVGDRIKALSGSGFRLGGDEFTIVCEQQSPNLVSELLESLSSPILLSECGEDYLSVKVNIGEFVNTTYDVDVGEGIDRADIALYQSKIEGTSYALYTERMGLSKASEILIEVELKQALTNKELVLNYQPIIDLKSRKLEGYEVLIRWEHPTRGLLLPGDFIPIASKSSLINKITEYIVQTIDTELSHTSKFIAINVTTLDLLDDNFLSVLELLRYKTKLILELVEDIDISDTKLKSILSYIKDSSTSLLALDDFGSGYNSMIRLTALPIDVVKIDKSFVSGEVQCLDICRAIVLIAKARSMLVIAEGIESEEQASLMEHVGCDMGQGYYFGRPTSIEHIKEHL